MTQYRKKPVVVEAFQMTKERRWDNSEWPDWLNLAWQKEPGEGAFWCDKENTDRIFVGTLRGVCELSFGDWIIRGVKGELYPCVPDVFGATHEAVEGKDGSD